MGSSEPCTGAPGSRVGKMGRRRRWPGPRGTRTPGLRRPTPPSGCPSAAHTAGLEAAALDRAHARWLSLGPLLPRQPQRLWAHWLWQGSTPAPPLRKGGSPIEEEAPKIAWGLNSVRPVEASGPPTRAGLRHPRPSRSLRLQAQAREFALTDPRSS